jgi:anti-sigma regulatory factor (Ser/Thr protein kinase)
MPKWAATVGDILNISEYARKEAVQLGVGKKNLDKLNLAVEEITANIIFHGYKDNPGGMIEVLVEKVGPNMVIHLMDEGIPFNPLEAGEPDIDAPMEKRQVGGLGIFMAKKLVDTIQYQRVGNRNHVTLIQAVDGPGRIIV